MDDASLLELSLPQDILEPLFSASNSSSLEETLEILVESARTDIGRSDLASKAILPAVLQLTRSLPYPSGRQYLILSLKLLRNLCAGEILNQNSFIDQNGVVIVSTVLRSVGVYCDPDHGFIRMGLQVLANVIMAGEQHQQAVWSQLFPDEFLALARVRSRETCDPLCKVIYTCTDVSPQMLVELCRDQELGIVAEIIRTASSVGFGEDWLKLLLSRMWAAVHFPLLFSKLHSVDASKDREDATDYKDDMFSPEQAFLLRIICDILDEEIREIMIPGDLAFSVLEIFKRSVKVVGSISRINSDLPTGSAPIDVLGYSLTVLRYICSQQSSKGFKENSGNVMDMLLASGLIELLLCLLHDLEPPAIIRKALKQSENQVGNSLYSSKTCPYKGFRRDIVAVIGNCAYQRKHVQDDIREKNGIFLLLQQCIADEDNPFLREWGIWTVRNLLEGNEANQRVVADLELQGSIDVPELTGLGLRVEVDQKTRTAKLVNVPRR